MRVFLSEFHMEKTVHPLHYYPPSFMVWGFMLYVRHFTLYTTRLSSFIVSYFTFYTIRLSSFIARHFILYTPRFSSLIVSYFTLYSTSPFTYFFTSPFTRHLLFDTLSFTLIASLHSLFGTLASILFVPHDSSLACREISIENICACGRVK